MTDSGASPAKDVAKIPEKVACIMVKIKTLLGEEHETNYQFYTLYPGRKSGNILCFHIKSCTNIPEKMAMFNDYLYFEEQILPKVYYKTRRSMIVKCPKCGEKYHQEKNISSSAGSYHVESENKF